VMTPATLHTKAWWSSQKNKEYFCLWAYLELSVITDVCQSNLSSRWKRPK